MVGMGLSLTVHDFGRVLRRPRPAIGGLLSILLLTPMVGLMLALVFELPEALAVGLVMIAACPGGTFSNLLSHYARGDLALSVSLTAVASLAAVFTMPFVVTTALRLFWHGEERIYLPFGDTVLRIFLLTVLPIMMGMTVARLKPALARALADPVKNLAAACIVFIFAYLLVIQGDVLLAAIRTLAFPVLTLNLVSVTIGMLIGIAARAGQRERVAITMEHAIKQEGMGIFIAGSLIGDVRMTLPLMLNSWIGVLVGVGLVIRARRRAGNPRNEHSH